MSFNVNALSTYTDNKGELIKKAIVNVKTVARPEIELRTGIKYSEQFSIVSSAMAGQAASCGWSTSGTTTLSPVTITVNEIDFKEALCPKTLNQYGLAKAMKAGSAGNEELPVEEVFVNEKIDSLGQIVEQMIWRSSTTAHNGEEAVTANNTLSTGLLYRVFAASASTTNIVSTGWTSSNALAKVDTAELSIPAANFGVVDYFLYVAPNYYSLYIQALRVANLFHVSPTWEYGQGVTHPSAGRIVIVPTQGMAGSDYGILAPKGALFIGTDLLSDNDELKIWYSQDNDEVRTKATFKIGTAVAFASDIVRMQLA